MLSSKLRLHKRARHGVELRRVLPEHAPSAAFAKLQYAETAWHPRRFDQREEVDGAYLEARCEAALHPEPADHTFDAMAPQDRLPGRIVTRRLDAAYTPLTRLP